MISFLWSFITVLFKGSSCDRCDGSATRVELALAEATGALLASLAVRAHKRGDTHASNHLASALLIGNACHHGDDFTGCVVGQDPLNLELLRDRIDALDLNVDPFIRMTGPLKA